MSTNNLYSSTCAATGKVRFASRRFAKRFADQKERQYGKKYSVYRCERCNGGWHLNTKRRWPEIVHVARKATESQPETKRQLTKHQIAKLATTYPNWV
jgi:hypothetical protein